MGRVYNALVKADRLPGRERPIGRPASPRAVPPSNSFGGPIASRPDETVKDTDIFQTQSVPLSTDENAETFFTFDFDSAAAAPRFQPDSNFNPAETFAKPRAAERFDAQPALNAPAVLNAPAALNSQPGAESFIAEPSAKSFTASPRHHATQHLSRSASQTAPASPIASPDFEEPHSITSLKSLTIDPHLVALTAEDTLAQERYRTLAVRVINAASRCKLKTLVVTSAEKGEGKSTVAINLAWSMAKRSERRVILIDASLRSPSISRMLGLASSRGWLNAADDLSNLADMIIRLDPNGLYVMASGILPTQANCQEATADINDALISTRFEKLLAELQQRFDFIVIDAPPVLGSADAQHLASIADGTVIVARASVTHHSRVSDALALVPEDRRVGIVLNESEINEEAAPHKASRSLIDRLFRLKK
jgi:protein-tyrosine kinase